MRRRSAVEHDRKRFTLVVPLPLLVALMALNFFTSLLLPAGVTVPAGAINPVAKGDGNPLA